MVLLNVLRFLNVRLYPSNGLTPFFASMKRRHIVCVPVVVLTDLRKEILILRMRGKCRKKEDDGE